MKIGYAGLLVWRLDRIARSLRNLLDLEVTLPQRGIHCGH